MCLQLSKMLFPVMWTLSLRGFHKTPSVCSTPLAATDSLLLSSAGKPQLHDISFSLSVHQSSQYSCILSADLSMHCL